MHSTCSRVLDQEELQGTLEDLDEVLGPMKNIDEVRVVNEAITAIDSVRKN